MNRADGFRSFVVFPLFHFLFSIFCFAQAVDDPSALVQRLNALRVDGAQVYRVRELSLRRDAVRILFEEGKLALLAAPDGRVTGAVFTGEGRIIAVPRDAVEKASLVRFLGTPLLDQAFSRAYFRFTDNTAEELREQIARAGATPFVELSFAEDWDPTVANLNPQHSPRILMDFLARQPQPYFFASIAGEVSGAFEVLVDNRRAEQIRIGQMSFVEGLPYFDTWTSFARADQAAPVAAFEPLGYAIETTISAGRVLQGETMVQMKTVRAGERVVPMEISRKFTVTEVTDTAGRALPFFPSSEMTPEESALRGDVTVLVVLPEAFAAGQTVRLRVHYRGNVPDAGDASLAAGTAGSWHAHVAGSKFVPVELSFRWPRTLSLTASGKKLEEHEDGEWRTGKWKLEDVGQQVRVHLGDVSWRSVVTAGNYRDAWIAEGLAGYRALLTEETKQPGQLAAQLENYRRALTSPSGEYATLDAIGPLALGYRLHSSKSPRGFARLARPKAVWVFHMLRMMLQKSGATQSESPGSDRFEKLLQSLTADYLEQAMTTADLQREVEKVMTPEMDLEGTRKTAGRPGSMDWFFDDWVRGAGIPKYSVEFAVKSVGDRLVMSGTLKQSGVPASFIAPVPIYAAGANEEKPVLLGTVISNGAETPFQFTVRAAPKKLLIDPNRTLLCLTE